MNERKRPFRRGRGPRSQNAEGGDPNPYADVPDPASPAGAPPPPPPPADAPPSRPVPDIGAVLDSMSERPSRGADDSADSETRGRGRGRGRGSGRGRVKTDRTAGPTEQDFDRAVEGPPASERIDA